MKLFEESESQFQEFQKSLFNKQEAEAKEKAKDRELVRISYGCFRE